MARVVYGMISVFARSAGVALLLAILAGCVGGGGSKGGPLRPGAEPVFDDETGAIRGLVTDDEGVPIAGAQAGIPELGIVATSDEGGFIALNRVPPGDHAVVVVAMGYDPASRVVTVTAGEATEMVEFLLVRLASDVPYHRTVQRTVQLTGVMWKLTPQCIYEPLTSINPLLKTCGGIRQECPAPDDSDPCEDHTADPDFKGFNYEWQTIVSEVQWTPQTGATGKGFLHDINAPNITRGNGGSINQADKYTFKKSSNKSPIQIRVDKDALAGLGIPEKDWNNHNSTEQRCKEPTESTHPPRNCAWFYRLFPAAYDAGIGEEGLGPDYGVMYQTNVEIYFTFFIKEKAPAEFTALP